MYMTQPKPKGHATKHGRLNLYVRQSNVELMNRFQTQLEQEGTNLSEFIALTAAKYLQHLDGDVEPSEASLRQSIFRLTQRIEKLEQKRSKA